MAIEDFFKSNGIKPMTLKDLSADDLAKLKGAKRKGYYDRYYADGINIIKESLDYHTNLYLFGQVQKHVDGFQRLLEPCCGIGLLGSSIVYEKNLSGNLASVGNEASLLGIYHDAHAIGIANSIARRNELGSCIFLQGDIVDLAEQRGDIAQMSGYKPEAIIGRCAANDQYLNPNRKAIDAMTKISPNIFLIVPSDFRYTDRTKQQYQSLFNQKGFSVEFPGETRFSDATWQDMFFLKAIHN